VVPVGGGWELPRSPPNLPGRLTKRYVSGKNTQKKIKNKNVPGSFQFLRMPKYKN
jgi:hypothetical protein